MNSKRFFLVGIAAFLCCNYAHAETLSESFKMGIENEPRLKGIKYQTEAVEEQINQARSRLLPQLQGSLSWGAYGYDAEYLDKPVNENYKSYSISLSQALFHPEYWSGLDESHSRAQKAQFDYAEEVQKLGIEVAKSYFDVLKSEHTVGLARSYKEYYEMVFNQIQQMLTLGLSNRIDLLEASVKKENALSELLTDEKRLEVAKLKLRHMIKTPVQHLDTIDFNTIDLSAFDMNRTQWEAQLSNSPVLKGAQASLESATHQLSARKYDFYPKADLNLVRKETYTQDRISHTYDNQAVVQISIPIYQGGYSLSRVREGIKLVDAANQEIEYQAQQNRFMFEALWAEREYDIDRITVLRKSKVSADLYQSTVQQGYKAGLKSLVDLLDAKNKMYEIERNLIDSGFELLKNELSLLEVTGKLNVETLEAFEKRLKRSDKNL